MDEDGKRLTILFHDYNNARDDERYFITLQATLINLSLVALGAMFFVVKDISDNAAEGSPYPDEILAALPVIILVLLAFAEYLGAQAVLRSFYLRMLEREIRLQLPGRETLALPLPIGGPQYILSWTDFQANYSSLSNPKAFGSFLRAVAVGALFLVFGSISIFLSFSVQSLAVRYLMWLVYVPLISVVLIDNFRSVQGRSFYHRHAREVADRISSREREDSPSGLSAGPTITGGRSLLSYLVLPRPDDLLSKVWFVIAGVVLGWQASGHADRISITNGFWLIFAVEFLVYQARYQWNDIRGISEDGEAPTAQERGRLPGGQASVRVSIFVLTFRLLLVIPVVAGMSADEESGDAAGLILESTLAIFFLAIFYEVLRAKVRASQECSNLMLTCLLFLVSLGYPLRFLIGWFAAGASWGLGLLLVVASLAALGVLFVSMTWVLEGFSYVTRRSPFHDRVFGTSIAIKKKSHLLRLMKISGWEVSQGGEQIYDFDGRGFKPFVSAPFPNIWMAAAGCWYLTALLGLLLIGFGHAPIWLVTTCGLISLLACTLPAPREFSTNTRLFAAVLSSLAPTLFWFVRSPFRMGADLAITDALAGVLAAILPAVLILVFRGSSYSDTRNFTANLWKNLRGFLVKLMVIVFGPEVMPRK